MKPKINRSDIPKTKIKVGQPLKFDVNVEGEPPPEVTWELKGAVVRPDREVSIENPDYMSNFHIQHAQRKHAGVYKITAKNSSGVDEAEVEVVILGKPSAPLGPLEVSDVHEDHVNLDWQPPEDDGGTPIDHYEIEKLDTATGIWVPAGKSHDTKFTPTGLQKGKHYKFRVKAVNAEGASDPLENEAAILAKNPYDKPDKPGKPEATDWDKDHVDLKWDPPKSDGGAPVEKYVIEKRSKYGRWEPALEVPGDKTAATVPDLTEKEEYEFRIVAVNKGGASDPSDPSDSVVCKCRNCEISRHSLSCEMRTFYFYSSAAED